MNNDVDLSKKILSDVIVYSKYARYLPKFKRRETWEEIVDRNKNMHIKKYPFLKDEIEEKYKLIYDKKVLPSSRSLQFAGKPIEVAPNRMYNCCALPIDDWSVFGEIMFLLLGGSGVGFSVQFHHVDKLSPLTKPIKRNRRYLIADSIEGWAESINVLMRAYFFGLSNPIFDFSDIRPKGAPLITSGGKAPGPKPLKDCLYKIKGILDEKDSGDKLTSLEAYDILCHISDAVLSGGIRRAACAALFSLDDMDMLTCKSGLWYEDNPQRARANNSAMIMRHRIKRKEFKELWKRIERNKTGEPGFFLSNNMEMLVNPCQPARATVLTTSGISTIGDVVEGDFIWSGKRFTKVVKKWSTGIKDVFEYKTRAGIFIGTENHRVVSGGEKIEVKDAVSIDTSQGEKNTFVDPLWKKHPERLTYIMDGLLIGDGTKHKASGNLIGLMIGENDKDYFDNEINCCIDRHRPGINKYFYEIRGNTITDEELPETYSRNIPDRYFFGDFYTKAMFLRGLYSANGSIVLNRICLKAASFALIDRVQQMLSSLGIKSYYTTNKSKKINFKNGEYKCKESYDLNISTDRRVFANLIGFIQKYKNKKLDKICQKESKEGKNNYEIVETVHVGKEEVFDLTVEAEEHTYWTGGLLVSNCFEVSILPQSFCNLTTLNASDLSSIQDLEERIKVASFIGTLQASYTDFHFLRDEWKKNTEKTALLGMSMTGIASGDVLKYNLKEAVEVAIEENKRVAEMIGINPAARLTVVKPEGTSSLVLGTSSGIHAWYNDYYIRRIQLNKEESIYKYLINVVPDLIEDSLEKPHLDAFLKIPIKAPKGAITRDEPVMKLLERIKWFHENWIKPGHISGDNTNNVSATIFVKEDEWDDVGDWMWNNRDSYNGLATFPANDHKYEQPPLEDCSKYMYDKMCKHLKDIDLTKVIEDNDDTNLQGEIVCAGGACEVL
jgi:hypothetical protein